MISESEPALLVTEGVTELVPGVLLMPVGVASVEVVGEPPENDQIRLVVVLVLYGASVRLTGLIVA